MAPYFIDYILNKIDKWEDPLLEAFYEGGFEVYTTLDLEHQKIAEEEVKKQILKINENAELYIKTAGVKGVDTELFTILESMGKIFPIAPTIVKKASPLEKFKYHTKEKLLDKLELLTYLSPVPQISRATEYFRKDNLNYDLKLSSQGAFLSIEPRTGYITSLVGGADFSPKNQYNRALLAQRQLGSVFKIFVYGSAIENRIMSTKSSILDAPFTTLTQEGEAWSPVNYSEGYFGTVSLDRAFSFSLNTSAVQTYFKVGAEPHY